MGDGVAIKPSGTDVVAPVDGIIGKILDRNDGFSVESDSGLGFFVKIGTCVRASLRWTRRSR
jgi:PTS system glucose-specific IIA component